MSNKARFVGKSTIAAFGLTVSLFHPHGFRV